MKKATLSYSELRGISSYEERFEYLRLDGMVGAETFGFDRYINQQFYRSSEWKSVRQFVILRDNACDLGIPGHEIYDKIIVHHMNPMVADDIVHGSDAILDPQFLISVSHNTHQAIHYGDASLLPQPYVERTPNDTIPWR